jgi:hypothetical protein
MIYFHLLYFLNIASHLINRTRQWKSLALAKLALRLILAQCLGSLYYLTDLIKL